VLIIDDEPMAANLLELILTGGRNDEVIMALSGPEGLTMAEREQPDLIIVRIMMNLDGYEICRQLKQIPALAGVPVLLQAALPPERVYPTAQEVGAAGYLYQPFRPDVLIKARDAVLQGELFYPVPYPSLH
jgi:CheY-like chemotaxis protein